MLAGLSLCEEYVMSLKSRPVAVLLLGALLGVVLGCEPATPPVHTASAQVQVLTPPLPMQALARQRTIRLYLPPGYAQGDKRYPVLYVHDGQNLFDAATGYAGEWQVDETLDRLAASGRLELIVVGIDNGGAFRNQELSPFVHSDIPISEGEAYLKFIVEELKPFIDSHYRTMPDRDHTGLMGSSLGGLITHYAGQHYPQVFGRLGVLSPSYWVAGDSSTEQFRTRLLAPSVAPQSRWFVSMGGQEGGTMGPDFQAVTTQLQQQLPPTSQLKTHWVDDADHNEAAWAALMEPALLFLFAQPATPP